MTDAGPTTETSDEVKPGRTFWIGLAVGGAVMGYAVWGTLQDHLDTNPPYLLKWVLGLLVVHDLIVAPLSAALIVLVVRKLPASVRGPIGGALALSAIVIVFSIPLVRAFGRHELNSSTLPHDYVTNLAVVLGVIWIVAAGVVTWRVRRKP